MARHLGLIGFSFVAMALLIVATEATDYTVGDSFGWNIPPNDSFYSDWASSKNFLVGDTLCKLDHILIHSLLASSLI